jgi:hypothetical protein
MRNIRTYLRCRSVGSERSSFVQTDLFRNWKKTRNKIVKRNEPIGIDT